MEHLILEAYDNANSNEFFAITLALESLINKRYPRGDYRREITTGRVRRVLEAKSMDYILVQPSGVYTVFPSCQSQERQARPIL